MKNFENIYIENLNINETLFEGAKIFTELSKLLGDFLDRKFLQEQTKSGIWYKKEFDLRIDKLEKINNRLKFFAESTTETPDIEQTKTIIKHFNNLELPYIFEIIKTIFNKEENYDKEDKELILKTCQKYEYLYNFYKHYLHKISLRVIELRNYKANDFNYKDLIKGENK